MGTQGIESDTSRRCVYVSGNCRPVQGRSRKCRFTEYGVDHFSAGHRGCPFGDRATRRASFPSPRVLAGNGARSISLRLVPAGESCARSSRSRAVARASIRSECSARPLVPFARLPGHFLPSRPRTGRPPRTRLLVPFDLASGLSTGLCNAHRVGVRNRPCGCSCSRSCLASCYSELEEALRAVSCDSQMCNRDRGC